MKIAEKRFRGSQVCRALSYPIAYGIVRILLVRGPLTFDEIVKLVGRSKPAVCHHLSKLRLANIVRFERGWRKTVYFVKYPEEIKEFLNACEKTVERITRRLKKDL